MNVRNSALPANLLRLGAGALGLAAVGVLLVQGSEAAFTASTDNKGNIVEAGTVVLSDSGAGTAMFNVGNVNGGQTITRCIKVDYSGSLTADIKLHGKATGNISPDKDLAPGLATTIELGSGVKADCSDFAPAGSPSFTGPLSSFVAAHSGYGSGIAGYANATSGTTKSYRITMTVSNENKYQGTSAGVDFTWEAQGQDVTTSNRTAATS